MINAFNISITSTKNKCDDGHRIWCFYFLPVVLCYFIYAHWVLYLFINAINVQFKVKTSCTFTVSQQAFSAHSGHSLHAKGERKLTLNNVSSGLTFPHNEGRFSKNEMLTKIRFVALVIFDN